jgi:hypothetical protein
VAVRPRMTGPGGVIGCGGVGGIARTLFLRSHALNITQSNAAEEAGSEDAVESFPIRVVLPRP